MMNMIPARSMRPMNPCFPFEDSFFRPMFDNRGLMRVDVREASDRYVIEAELPGINREDLSVEVSNNLLTISVEAKKETEDNKSGYIRRERRFGSMKRSFSLEGIREADITAQFKDGLLTLDLPKETENENVRKIEIA